jgi:hypothetical protein
MTPEQRARLKVLRFKFFDPGQCDPITPAEIREMVRLERLKEIEETESNE